MSRSKLEETLRLVLKADSVNATGQGGGGCINAGAVFVADGKKIYVKRNSSPKARELFVGEMESLKTIAATGTIRVPHPLALVDDPEGRGSMLVTEYLDLKSVGSKDCELGTNVARMHLHNLKLGDEGSPDYVSKFGFHVPTCCGEIPQGNKWEDDWVVFYTNKLQEQMDLVGHGDAEASTLWQKLQKQIPKIFEDIPEVRPSLMHGDLWSGNVGQAEGKAVIFDPGSFYGHHEFDLGIAGLFGMSGNFFKAYHDLIPKEKGFERRHQLYKLFHLLNHWNHFGGGYRSQSISTMKGLLK